MKKLNLLFTFLFVLICVNAMSLNGRIAIIADGNSPDPDDISGTPASIVMLRIFGLNDKLVHYSHSCDLSGMADREKMMEDCLFETAEAWGGFDTSDFFNYDNQRKAASDHLAKCIDKSSSNDLLYVIGAGETDLLYDALAKANKDKRKFVRYIQHHPANDVGDYHDLDDILRMSGVPASKTFQLRIHDQNENLKLDISNMYWARNHNDSRVNIMWKFVKLAESESHDFRSIDKKADISDAGMVWYLCTGFKDQDCSYEKFEKKVNDWLGTTANDKKVKNLNGTYYFKNKATGKYLDLEGTSIKAKEFTGKSDQKWQLVKVDGKAYNIDSKQNKKGVIFTKKNNEVRGSSKKPKVKSSSYKWVVESLGNNTYRFKNSASGRAYLAENRSNNKIEYVNWNGERSQWILEKTNTKSAAVSVVKDESQKVLVYPNPATSIFKIRLQNIEKANVAIFNLAGKLVYKRKDVTDSLDIQIGKKFNPGLYIVKVNTDNKQFIEKLIVK